MGANSQLLMSYGANSWPGSPEVVYDFSRGSAINAGGTPCTTYLEEVATLKDLSPNARNSTQGTSANRAKFLPAGDGYLLTLTQFNSSSDKNYISRGPYLDSALGITVDARIAPEDWTPGAINVIACKGPYGSAFVGDQAWSFFLTTAGNLSLNFWAGGGAANAPSTANLSALANNSELWVRANYEPDIGGGLYRIRYYTSPDGSTWTQLGADVTGGVHNTNANAQEITLGASGNANDNLTRLLGRYYQFRYYINGVLTVDWRAEDSQHLFSWGPLNTGVGGFISYANNSYLIKEDSVFADGNDSYSVIAPFAPGTSWLTGMKGQVGMGGNYFMTTFEGAAGVAPNMSRLFPGQGTADGFVSGGDSSLAAATTANAANIPFQRINNTGNVITDRTGAVITLQVNEFTATPSTTTPAGGNIAQFFAGVTIGVLTRAIKYGSAKPSNAALKTWLGEVPGRNMFMFSQDFEYTSSAWQYIAIAVSPKVEANPLDGKVNAALVTLTGGASAHYLYKTFGSPTIQAQAYCVSIYVKRPAVSPNRYFSLGLSDASIFHVGMVFDTTTWTPSYTDAGVTGGAIDVGGGWYRLWVSYTYASAYANGYAAYTFTTAGAVGGTVNANGEGLYLFGAQWHPGTYPDPYRPKTVLLSPSRYYI